MKTTLTIEESSRLIELGVDAKLASECQSAVKVCASGRGIIRLPESRPIFTLSDLLSILPKGIIHEGLSCKFRITSWYDEPYFAGYEKQVDGYVCIFDAPELIDALNQLLIWCLTEKKINLNTEKI